jgi:hypothetical protein
VWGVYDVKRGRVYGVLGRCTYWVTAHILCKMTEGMGRGQTKRFSQFAILQVGVLESWECKPWDGPALVVALLASSVDVTSYGPRFAKFRLYKIPPVLFPSFPSSTALAMRGRVHKFLSLWYKPSPSNM